MYCVTARPAELVAVSGMLFSEDNMAAKLSAFSAVRMTFL